jgi:membrane-associated phospholipid phosphatase
MMQDFWNDLLANDKAVFAVLNGKWTNSFFDAIMPWVRDSKNWIPLYMAILAVLFYKWGKKAWKWVLMVVINVALTDQISSSFFKPFFHRLRPCADPTIMHQSRLLLDHCSGGFSFTSSHAANHFGLAMFIVMTLQPLLKNYRYLFLIWAALICYAQIYVGVHFPLDVFVGSIIGISVGYLSGKLYYKIAGRH